MSIKWRLVGISYLAFALATAIALICVSYTTEALQRHHTVSEWVVFVVGLIGMSAIWPYTVAVFLLLHFGILAK